VSDGRHLWLWANAEVVASCDLDGTTRWVTSHPKRFGIQSPVLSGGRLIVCSTRFGQTTGGMVTGFDAQTGERVWEVETGLGTPVTDISTGNCGSPLPLVLGQGPDAVAVVVTENGSVIRSRDGAILRQHLGIKEVYGTPIAMGPAGVLFSPQRHHAGYDLLLDETGQVGTRLRWHRRRVHAGYNPADYQLLDDNLLYHHGVRLDVHDVATGAPISTQAETQWNRSGAPFVAPVLAGRHLYVGDLGCITKSAFRDGGMSVATAGPVPLLLSRNRIRQLSNGPVADGDCLYVRQWHSLLCLGPTGPAGERYAAETVASELLSTLPPQPLPGPPVKATDPLNQDDAKSSRNMLIPTVVPGGWVVVGPVPEARGEDLRRLLLRLPAERFLGVQQPGRLDQDGLSAALIPVPGLGTEDEAYIASKDHMQYNRASFKAAQERGLALGSPVWARNLIASNFHSPIPGGELVLKPATLLPGGRLMLLTIVAPSTAGPLRWCEAGPGIRAWLDELELTHGLAVEMDQRPRRLMIELRPEAAERTYRPCFWYSQDETKDLAIWRAAVAQRRTYFDTLLAKAPDSPLAAIVRGILAAVGP
jgi:hypothetical protein